MSNQTKDGRWMQLAENAASETDPEKVVEWVRELERVLGEDGGSFVVPVHRPRLVRDSRTLIPGIRFLYFSPTALLLKASKASLPGGRGRLGPGGSFSGGNNRMTIPGLSDLLKDIKTLEDYARACRSREEERLVLLTREEVDVIESFRRFMAQDYA
jgi:hypothetical protein